MITRPITLIAMAGLLLGFGSAHSYADECPTPAEPVIQVKLLAPAAATNPSLSRAEITERSKQQSQGEWEEWRVSLGRTEIELSYDMDASAATAGDGHGGYCAAIAAVEVAVRLKTTKYIASELVPGTCMYDAVSQHEERHVQVIRRYQSQIEERLRRAISATARRPAQAPTPSEGVVTVKGDLWTVVKDTMETLVVALGRDQAPLDTPESYDEPRKICGEAAYNAAFAN
ncbi:hypothetical protein [Dongia sp.]|uniref:hypothetical protein n=1 Tax=Dongia sp. TaxID=1977262 RepID=UPI003750AB37